MTTSTEATLDELYADYRSSVFQEVMVPAVRRALMIFSVINLASVGLDYILYPQHFGKLVVLRATVSILHGLVFFRWIYSRPAQAASLAALLVGLLIVAFTALDQSMARYTAFGSVIFFCGAPVLLPLSAREFIRIDTVTFLGFLGLTAIVSSGITPGDLATYCFFPAAGALVGVGSSALMDNMRFNDYLRRRELEEARDNLAELDRAKSRFSSNVHHELRTPLTLILAPLASLRSGAQGQLNPEITHTLEVMNSNGQRLYRMINNLLDMSKAESGQLSITRSRVDLPALIADVVLGAGALADRKSVTLGTEGIAELPEIQADPDALEKVLVNLIGNSLKFTDEGGSIIVRGEGSETTVLLTVEDTGVGVPPDKLESIFDRFAQVDSSTTRRYEGTGIGLSLTRELVELHGGRVWAESDGEGHGTTMTVELPLGELDAAVDPPVLRSDADSTFGIRSSFDALESVLGVDSTAAQGAEEHLASNVSVGHADDVPEVLIAEDNPDMRELLASVIGSEFRYRLAENGRIALELHREEPADLVLSDVMMPELSGIDLCKAIKADPALGDTPVVLVTSKAEHEMKIEGLEIGADDYVTKPFHPRELLARVRSLVRVRGLQRQLAGRNDELEHALNELKQAEAHLVQSERLSAVGELAAEIAHEINNPVNFALNAARTLGRSVKDFEKLALTASAADGRPVDPAEAGELVEMVDELSEIICDGLNRTHALVGNLRDFASPEKLEGQRVAVDVGRGIHSTLQLVKHTLSEMNARVHADVAPDLPQIQGDPAALNQVFLNLVKNAGEAFGGEGGEIRIEARAVNGGIEVVIADDGPGIPEALQSRLFEPFFTTKETGKGTGLGLAISRRIVESHGGSLKLCSVEGEGTRFTITLPTIEGSTA